MSTEVIVDNIYRETNKGVTYAIDDYCGFDPVSQWMQTPPEEEGASGSGSTNHKRANKRRAKAKSRKHLSASHSKSHN